LAYEQGFLRTMSAHTHQDRHHPLPTQAKIDELFAFLPVFSEAEYQPIRQWHGGPIGPREFLMPWPEYDDAVEAFIRVASKDSWSNRRYDSAEVSRMLNDEITINQAKLADIKSMLTFCVPGE